MTAVAATAGHAGRPRSTEADQALIGATLAILEEEGYAGLSMAGVAKRAGVSATTLYRRWPSKEELVGAALVSLKTVAEAPDTGSLEGDLREMLGHSVAAFGSEPGRVLRGLIGEMFKNAELGALARERLGAAGGDIVGVVLRRAVERGEIPEPDPHLARNLIAGPLFHRFLIEGEMPSKAVVDGLVRMIAAGLKAGAG